MLNFLILIVLFFSPLFSDSKSYDFETIKKNIQKSDEIIYDRYGKVLHETRVKNEFRRLSWVGLSEISEVLINSTIVAEDKRFYEHSGVDWRAVVSSFFRLFTTKPKRGASTITMQVVALLNEELKNKTGSKTFSQKFQQILEAKDLERYWTKHRILEAYFNLVTFKGELVGIHAASRGLFGKSPHGLNTLEALVLSSLIKNPSFKESKVKQRAFHVAKLLELEIEKGEIESLVDEIYSKQYVVQYEDNFAFHLSKKIFQTKISEPIFTTLDKNLQLFAIESIKQQMSVLKEKNVRDSSVLVLENSTGNVVAYVGSSGKFSNSPEIDGVVSKRQAGSTLKPFVYALAFERNLITASSNLEDTPIDIQVGSGIYSPSNYQNEFHGLVPAHVALASSLNVPAVRVLNLVGPDEFVGKLEELEFQNLKEGKFYGLSIALGSLDVSLLQLTNAYRMFANKGVYSGINFYLSEPEEKNQRTIFTEQTSNVISEILSSRESRSLTFGLENPLSTRFWTAVKTGTSKDMRDNWCIGYSEKFTVGVWVGNFSGEPMWNVSGISGAAPIWANIMNWLYENYNSETARETKIKENFYQKISVEKTPTDHSGQTQILYPPNGTILAIDPDIPSANQVVFFEPGRYSPKNYWYLNGKKIGSTKDRFGWELQKGYFFLEIKNELGKTLDKSRFEVR